jgi:hypothetical protein
MIEHVKGERDVKRSGLLVRELFHFAFARVKNCRMNQHIETSHDSVSNTGKPSDGNTKNIHSRESLSTSGVISPQVSKQQEKKLAAAPPGSCAQALGPGGDQSLRDGGKPDLN